MDNEEKIKEFIDKLGLKSNYKPGIVNGDIILKVEKQRNELLVSSIRIVNNWYQDQNNAAYKGLYMDFFRLSVILEAENIIEEITDLSWQDIKGLLRL